MIKTSIFKTTLVYVFLMAALWVQKSNAQANIKPYTKGYNLAYHFIGSGNLVVDKNFYLLTVINHTPAIKNLLGSDAVLKELLNKRIAILKSHATDTCRTPVSLLNDFRWTGDDSLQTAKELTVLYNAHQALFNSIVDNHLRPSGYYERFRGLSNQDLLSRAWNQYFYGINYLIDQFGLGKKMRYPLIDSPNYVVNTPYYKTVLKDIFASLDEVTDNMDLFYKPSLQVALQLMQANDRDEPARFEPLEAGENKLAFEKVHQTQWGKYPYAAIVIPGNGPPLNTTPISPDIRYIAT
jgi:hypothetical protein